MAPQDTRSQHSGTLKGVTFLLGRFTLRKTINKAHSSLRAQVCKYNTSNSGPSSKRLRPRLSLLVKAMKIGKMESTDASTAPSNISNSPSNVGGGESPATSPIGGQVHSTPEEISVRAAVPMTKAETGTATVVTYKRPRANATVSNHGSPVPRKPVDPRSSPCIRHGLGPTMRTSRDAYQVIMGENPPFPPRSSSLPTSAPSTTTPPKVSAKAPVVSRFSHPTASSSARNAREMATSTSRSTSAVKTPSAGRHTSATNSPSASIFGPATNLTVSAVRSTGTSATRSIDATRTSNTVKSTSMTKMTSATQIINRPKTTSSPRSVKLHKAANANRPVNMTRTTGITRTASVKRVPGARISVRPAPRSGTMTSLKSASKGFKSRISAMITNHRRRTDTYQDGFEQELRPLAGRGMIAESDGESPNEKPLPSSPSSLPNGNIEGEDQGNFLLMSRDQLDRLVHAAQEMKNEGKKEVAIRAVNAYGEALIAVNAAHKANMDLQAAIVLLSREATDLGSQALALIQG